MWAQSQQNAKLRMLFSASGTKKPAFSSARSGRLTLCLTVRKSVVGLRFALRREATFTSAALRRGKSGCGEGIEARSLNLWAKSGANYIGSIVPERQYSIRMQTRIKGQKGNPVASTLLLGHGTHVRGWQVIWSQRLSTFRASTASVLANQSLNRTHCSVPSFGLKKPSPNANTPQWAG